MKRCEVKRVLGCITLAVALLAGCEQVREPTAPLALPSTEVQLSTTTTPCLNLVVTKFAGSTPPLDDQNPPNVTVQAGDSISFRIVVKNACPGDLRPPLTDVVLTDQLPTGPGINWSIWVEPGTKPVPCWIVGNTLTCTFDEVERSRHVTVTSATTQESCGVYENRATVTASNHATVQSNLSTITVTGCPQPTPPIIKCPEGIRDLRIRNLGIPGNPLITVTGSDARKSGEIIWFQGNVPQNTSLNIYPPQASDFHVDARTPVQGKADKKLGSFIFIYVGDAQRPLTKIHTACSQPVGPGLMTPTMEEFHAGFRATPDVGNLGPNGSRPFLVTQAFVVPGGEMGATNPRVQDHHFKGKGQGVPVPQTVIDQVRAGGGL